MVVLSVTLSLLYNKGSDYLFNYQIFKHLFSACFDENEGSPKTTLGNASYHRIHLANSLFLFGFQLFGDVEPYSLGE